MRSKIVRIGNSQGVRLPKLMIEEAGLNKDVELRVEDGQIVIAASRIARAGWADAAQRAHAAADDQLQSSGATRFDATEWEGRWRPVRAGRVGGMDFSVGAPPRPGGGGGKTPPLVVYLRGDFNLALPP